MSIPLSEHTKSVHVERSAERYARKYSPYVNLLESKSLLSKVRPITTFDIYSLGKQLESWEVYRDLCEEDGTLAQLGRIPDVAFDVITVNYGTSPISVISTNQPIDEERGIIYYKNIVAQSTRGNVTAGQNLYKAVSAEDVSPVGFASDTVTNSLGITAAGTTGYSFTLNYPPLRPGNVRLQFPDLPALEAQDNGRGQILGYGIEGTINYQTGALVIEFRADPGAGHPINVVYSTDFEAADDLPKIIFKMDTKMVQARIFALKDTVGLEQSYVLRRRFGLIAEDEIASDLVASINAEIVNTLVMAANANAMGQVTWSKTPDSGVSYYDHKLTFKDTIADAESIILGNAGRGNVNTLIAGRNASSLLSTLPGFSKISDGTTVGPHVFGTLDGMNVIRVPNNNVLDGNTIIAFYTGASPFEAALAYCPYMPLVVTTALPMGTNPLMNQKAAAVWAATEVLVPQFITKIVIA